MGDADAPRGSRGKRYAPRPARDLDGQETAVNQLIPYLCVADARAALDW